jgi:6-phosphogluconolactonase
MNERLTRRSVLHTTGILLAASIIPRANSAPKSATYLMYVGTYTGPNSKGIYAFRWDPKSGKTESIGLAGEVVNPSFVALHPNGQLLYAVSELGNDGKTNGAVTAFAIDRKTGMLTKLNSVSSGGGGSCHLVVDHTGKMLIVANYGSGSVASFPVGPDGRIGELKSLMKHTGSGPDRARQRGPHTHGAFVSPDNRFVVIPDLGLDQIWVYKIDPATAQLTENDPPFVSVKPGSGPRHFTFSPNGKFAYVVQEMGSMVTAFSYNAAKGTLTELQETSTLPADFKGQDNSAEIGIDPKGHFLYASNRGHDSIAEFAIDPKKGTLRLVEITLTQGKIPRNFKLDPTGRYLFAANQKSNNIVVFHVDPKSGKMTPAHQVLDAPAPVCIEFLPA